MVDFGVIYAGYPHNATSMPIGKATNVAIDDAILSRAKAVMPTYQSQKSFVNQLLDQALQQIELEVPMTQDSLPQ